MELIYVGVSFFVIIVMITIILNLNKTTKLPIEPLTKELFPIIKEKSDSEEAQRFFWYVLANLIFEEKMYGFVMRYLNDKRKMERNGIDHYLMAGHIKSIFKSKLLNDNDNNRIIWWVLSYRKTKSLECLKNYSIEEYMEFLKEFEKFIDHYLIMGNTGDLELLKRKITDVQPERESELTIFIKKQKIKYMFSIN